VLAHAIVREGAKAVAAGMNPMDLKRGVAVGAVVAALQKNSKIADKSTAPYSSFPSGELPGSQ
jgi:chaperonin GroEL